MVGGVNMSILGDRLRALRESKGWSQKYVATKLGIKQSSTYSNWEYGLRDPDTDTLTKLADLYEVQTDYLLGRDHSMTILPRDQTDFVIREIVEKYGVDLKKPGAKEKLEQIIQLVFGDMKQ
jgi:transcriptional regulator with XRE-family HTH domain